MTGRRKLAIPHESMARLLLESLLLSIAISTCGGKLSSRVIYSEHKFVKNSINSSEVIEELQSYKMPENIDRRVFNLLKEELVKALRESSGRFANRVPMGRENLVEDLSVVSLEGLTLTLSWHYRNVGDYNQDGVVNIGDVLPLARSFRQIVTSANEWIDGNNDRAINIGDVSPLAKNFFSECIGYNVEGAPNSGTFSEIAFISLADASDGTMGRRRFTVELQVGDKRRFRVVPIDSRNSKGEYSNEVSINPSPPIVQSVTPTTGIEGEQVFFYPTISGTPPFNLLWNFGGGATPNVSSNYNPQVTLGSSGSYDCSLFVSNSYGSTTFPFTLEVVAQSQPDQLELWYLIMKNLYVAANVDLAIEIAERASQAGYTKAMVADFKFGVIDLYGNDYDQKVQRFLDGARAVGIEVIPSLVPIGYSDAFLMHNPNLIEGQPVVDAEFLVNDRVADVVQDPSTVIINGDFESHSGDSFTGWYQMDQAGVSTFADTSVFHSGGTSIRFENFSAGNPTGNDRIRQTISVKPWQCYAVSFWLKTENLSPVGSLGFTVFSADAEFKQLTFLTYKIQPTQDWTQYYLIFNSQDKTSVYLYLGIWGGVSGRFWIDDVTIENAGLINLIRRPGAPLTVKNFDGSITYTEGADFEYVSDPKMGMASYPGTYDLYHERPVITITPGSPIQDGDKLFVSYYHCVFVSDMQPAVCLSEPETYDIIRTTLTEINELIRPNEVNIAIDELRVVNWCQACQSRGMTPGELLADTTQRIEQIAHEVNPNWKVITWSDMYDPYHNARDKYYLVNGTLAGSWNGLPASWDIANWRHFGNRSETIEFFANRGHKQILVGFSDENTSNFTIDEWLTEAKPYPGVYAVMYTTWRDDFSKLEAWAQTVREWEAQN